MNPLQFASRSENAKAAVLTLDDFTNIADYAKNTFGLYLPPSKREMVFARLIKRLRRVGISEFSIYLEFIKRGENSAERSEFLSALTTNVTQFFREIHHFEFFKKSVLPSLIERARNGQKVRLWSAGCSAGQEPYSIAMTILDLCPDAKNMDIKILATDIDTKILDLARAGRYPIEERVAIPERMWSTSIKTRASGYFEIAQPPRDLISFAELNLIAEWPMRGSFDVIFCRNVAIYFDSATQSTLWNGFCNKLTDSGHLMIGHSERLSGPATQVMKNIGVTIYTKSKNSSDNK